MSEMLREIQAADMLGFQEMRDFRAAVKAEEVPAPCRSLGIGKRSVRVWSRRILQEWIDNQRADASASQSLEDDIMAM